ncbi:MAG: 16S rRNA (uracil(1498)-N(3))-methyltransferase [Desulfuromonadales bacterium]|nr:16S rRNA (uracil(1498)-N(3))-methyltransferase [Desulfuromonadales bacterium]
MPPVSGSSGGAGSLVRLAGTLQAGVPYPFSFDVVTALKHWRARCGMIVTVIAADEGMWRGRLAELNEDGGILIPFQRTLRPLESSLSLTVYQALPEKERFELILEKLTELGVTRIVPFVSKHSSTLAARDAKQPKSHRWPEVLRRAAVQCRRAIIPELSPCLDFAAVFADAPETALRLMLYEGEGVTSLKSVVAEHSSRPVALLIGPEGGFATEEVTTARRNGFLPVSLGPRILRTETAAISAATVIQYALGDLN